MSSSPSSSRPPPPPPPPPRRQHPRLIPDAEWYPAHRAPASNPFWTTFKTGLAMPPTADDSLRQLFRLHCLANGLWDAPDVLDDDANLPAFYRATDAIYKTASENYPAAPAFWLAPWIRAIVLDSCPRQGLRHPDEDEQIADGIVDAGYEGGSGFPRPMVGKGKKKERVSKFTEVFDAEFDERLVCTEEEWVALQEERVRKEREDEETFDPDRKGKGKERGVTHDEPEWFASDRKGKGKEREADTEYLQPRVYPISPPSTIRGKGRERTPKSTPSHPSRKNRTGDKASIAVADKIEPQIEYVIEQAEHWSVTAEDARKRAEQRVKDKIRKDREKERQARAEEERKREARFGPRVPGMPPAPGSTISRKSTVSSGSGQGQRTARTSAQTQPGTKESAPTRQPVSKPNAPSASATYIDQSTTSVLSTSSDALPYVMTDKERREKTMRVRRQFPSVSMPRLVETEQALLDTRGNVDAAVIRLGGQPKKGGGAAPPPIPKKSPLRRAGAVLGVRRSTEGQKRGSESSSGRQEKQIERTPAREPSRDNPFLTPPSTDLKTGTSKPSLHQRLQNAAHSAGRHLSLSSSAESPRRDSSRSASSRPASPRSPSLRSMLEALKRDTQPPFQAPSESNDRYYEFFVTKERAYKSGGDEEGAVNPLDGYRNTDKPLESEDEDGEEVRGRSRTKKYLDANELLREMQSSTGLTQMTEPGGDASDLTRWLDCSRLFRVDASKTGARERVRLAGLRRPLLQYQAFAVYWQMVSARRFGGGFVADSPGLGKTLVFLALIVAERQLAVLWDEVNRSRAAKDGRHLPLTGQMAVDECPSQRRGNRVGWIACPCVFTNPTSQMPPQPGVRITIVPASLMSNWRAEWAKHIDTSCHELDMRLLLAHDGSVADRADSSQMADLAANVSTLRAHKEDRKPDSARVGQERILVLTTAKSYDAWIERFKYGGARSHVMVPEVNVLRRKMVWTSGVKYNISFGIACADESHEEYTIDRGRAGVLARLPGNPVCWGYSGTPLEKGPRCVEGVLWALEKQSRKIDMASLASGWAQREELGCFKREIFNKLCKDFDSWSKAGTADAATLENLRGRLRPFLTTFMIRRSPDVRWFGHPLVSLNSNLHRDVFLKHNDQYDEQIRALKPEILADAASRLQKIQQLWDNAPSITRSTARPTGLGFNNLIHAQYKLRIFATCPALVKLTTGENPLTLKADELKKWRGNNERNSPYSRNLREIFETSPKLMWLRECILDLDKQKDVDGTEQKMIIITNFNCIAFILKLMIEYFLPFKQGRVGLMHAEMRISARTALLEAFTDAMTEDRHGEPVRRRNENIQFLIGTTPMLSKGLQLTRACNVVLMEPDHEFYRELQGYARVNRIGQKNPWTFTYRLIDDGSEVEKSILRRQKERGEFPGRPLKPGDVRKMGPRDDGASLEESDELGQSVSWTAPKRLSTPIAPSLRRMGRVDDLRNRALISKRGG